MTTVILCGGLGTRLHEEPEFRAKPMIEIGDWPILRHARKLKTLQGFRDFVLRLGYRGQIHPEMQGRPVFAALLTFWAIVCVNHYANFLRARAGLRMSGFEQENRRRAVRVRFPTRPRLTRLKFLIFLPMN